MDSIFKGDAAKALKIFNNIYQSGADVVMIFDEMLNITHFIINSFYWHGYSCRTLNE